MVIKSIGSKPVKGIKKCFAKDIHTPIIKCTGTGDNAHKIMSGLQSSNAISYLCKYD